MASLIERLKEAGAALSTSAPVKGAKEVGSAVSGAIGRGIQKGYSTIKSDIDTFTKPTTPPKPTPRKIIKKKAKEIEEAL